MPDALNTGHTPETDTTATESAAAESEKMYSGGVPNSPRELTEAEKNPVSSGAVEWHDPLDKPQPEQSGQTEKLALASLLLGIAAMVTLCALPVSIPLAVAGLICGIISVVRHEQAKALQRIGIILSCAAIGIALGVFVMQQVLQNSSVSVINQYEEFEQNLLS